MKARQLRKDAAFKGALAAQGKARLGTVVHMKNAAALALTAVKGEDQRELDKVLESARTGFNEAPAHVLGRRHHGPQEPGQGAQARPRAAEGDGPAPGLSIAPGLSQPLRRAHPLFSRRAQQQCSHLADLL